MSLPFPRSDPLPKSKQCSLFKNILDAPQNGAFYDVKGLFSTVNAIMFVDFGEDEIVRNDIVKGVIKAYRAAAAADADRRRRQTGSPDGDEVEW